jgi:3-dehydrosphinganine reductase
MNNRPRHGIITGGSSGIGKATALKLVKRGANMTLIARTLTQLKTAQAELESARVRSDQQVLILTADVSDAGQANAAIQQAIAQLGAPDWLILSAGIAHPGHFQTLPIEIFEQTMAINYFGSLYCIKAALLAMESRRKGHIVLISSGAGLVGLYGYSPYSPSKFALRGLAESLRGELKQLDISLSIVYPPDTDTPQLEAENRTKPLATQRITATAKTWSAEAVADSILRGIDRKTFAIAPGLEMSLLARLHSLFAPAIHWYCDRITDRSKAADMGRHTNQTASRKEN